MGGKIRFGLNTWAIEPSVNAENLHRVFSQISEIISQAGIPGKPVVEVFASADEGDLELADAIRKEAADLGFGVVACGFNPYKIDDKPSPHLVSSDAHERREAIKRVLDFIDFAAAVAVGDDTPVLSGPWHVRHKYLTGEPLSPEERGHLVTGLREIAEYAGAHGVYAGFEILNRFETYVINTVAEALEVLDEVGSPNIGIQWDSSHAYIDEPDFLKSLEDAVRSGHLFHVHLSENHRLQYGTGQIGPKTEDIIQTLRDGGYERGAVLELFCPTLYPAVGIWSPPQDPIAVARNSMIYLAEHMPSLL